MSARTLRSAAERKSAKIARRAATANNVSQVLDPTPSFSTEPHPECEIPEPVAHVPAPEQRPAISASRLAANRANAQLSTGPTTPEGRAKVSLNALKSGLTGRTILLPSDDVAEYQRVLDLYCDEFKPVGVEESARVQSLVDICWRLDRIPGLESALFARGRIEFADSFNDRPAAERPLQIELQVLMVYEKVIRNLRSHEARLVRRREKETAELRTLQQKRKAAQAEREVEAATACLVARHKGQPFNPAALGFEFSMSVIERRLAQTPDQIKQRWLQKHLASNAGDSLAAAA